jgi:hypothetical protein
MAAIPALTKRIGKFDKTLMHERPVNPDLVYKTGTRV